jgi:nucleoside-diphosphate-sugar epimerase
MPAEEFELERIPSYTVDVPRRWPSVEKAKRVLGFEAAIGPREGIAQTVEWLQEQRVGASG